MKRLSGWDAVLQYSQTPTVHMHTLKLAVMEKAMAQKLLLVSGGVHPGQELLDRVRRVVTAR